MSQYEASSYVVLGQIQNVLEIFIMLLILQKNLIPDLQNNLIQPLWSINHFWLVYTWSIK